MEPPHSPFGLVGQIARDTGWSVRYILHGVNYPSLMLMWKDCSRHVPSRRKTPAELSREMSARSGSPPKNMSPLEFFMSMDGEE